MNNTDNKKQRKRLPGFYIALSCCVLAVGLVGFFSQNANSPKTKEPELAAADTELSTPVTIPTVVSEPEPQTEDQYVPEDAAAAATVEEYAVDNPDTVPAAFVVNAEESGGMGDPVPPAAVLTGFSAGTLSYNETYSDWRTHNGIDIAAEIGCSVSAAADGTVTDVGKGGMGNYVVIDHGNGITALYAQLNDVIVAVGDYVKSGSVIGTIAEPCGEGGAPHLHYELQKDGRYVDPEEY